LIIIAEVGTLGMPNSGKSTLVKKISNAKTKISDYPFTTLNPILGSVKICNKKFIIADIPGLIKGASKGRGLGINFLKHLERCKILLHIVDLYPIDKSNPIDNILIILNEIKKYSLILYHKPKWLVFNKIDLLSKKDRKKIIENIIRTFNINEKYYEISALHAEGTVK
ncbi:50S ribosome-binding GTPase, partial [Buchnera aphidicola]|nr:50S ribosome-binding GTPase [Buchnera aphidicola]